LCLVVVLALTVGCGRHDVDAPDSDSSSTIATALEWEESWDRAFKRARAENKLVMVEFYADWCVWCKRMESTTFRSSQVVSLLAGHAVPLRLDAEGEGRVLAGRFNVQGFPTIVFLDSDEREVGRVPGFMEAADFAQEVAAWLE
jgi:thiol:disulfide interchange protein